MTDIIKLAREAGATPYTNRHYPDRPTHTFNVEQLERFAELVAAQEREACHQIAIARYDSMKATEKAHYRLSDRPFNPNSFGFDLSVCMESKDIAGAIRARAKEQT